MRQGNGFCRAGAAKDVATVSTVVFAVGKGEFLATSHADIRVGPLGRCGTVKHATGDVHLWREVKAFTLQILVDLADVDEVAAAVGGCGPRLDEVEDFLFNVIIESSTAICLEERGQVVDELARGNLSHEVSTSVLDTGIGQVQGGQLDVWIFVAYAALE